METFTFFKKTIDKYYEDMIKQLKMVTLLLQM